MDFLFVYITVPDMDTARALARGALQQRLAACANILPQMTSMYEWEGVLEEASELVLILKTASHKQEALEQWIQAHHPYQVPCILRLPIAGGNQAYLDWLREGLREAPPP
jgi:periplasmic divalent cation tolerance protein